MGVNKGKTAILICFLSRNLLYACFIRLNVSLVHDCSKTERFIFHVSRVL